MILKPLRQAVVLAIAAGLLAACESPVAYRPEVEQFQKATAEAAVFMEAERQSVIDLRADLRRQVLGDRRPFVEVSQGCAMAIQAFNQQAGAPEPAPLGPSLVDDCRLAVADDPVSEELFNPRISMSRSAAFATAVANYAATLNEVATSGDQAGFVSAVDGLGNAATSLATSAATAAGKKPPDIPELSLIAAFVAKATFYYLENKRAEALKDAARSAHPWIQIGSAGVVRVLYGKHFEEINVANFSFVKRVDEVNEAGAGNYVSAADEAIRALGGLQSLLGSDPGAPFRKLPVAHAKLIEAFDDPERHLAGAIAAAKDLFESARAAHAAIIKD